MLLLSFFFIFGRLASGLEHGQCHAEYLPEIFDSIKAIERVVDVIKYDYKAATLDLLFGIILSYEHILQSASMTPQFNNDLKSILDNLEALFSVRPLRFHYSTYSFFQLQQLFNNPKIWINSSVPLHKTTFPPPLPPVVKEIDSVYDYSFEDIVANGCNVITLPCSGFEGYIGYYGTHCLLYYQAARRLGCEKRNPITFPKKKLDEIILQSCANHYAEANYIMRQNKTEMAYENLDLFAEIVALCGFEGFLQFGDSSFRQSILSMERQKGCFMLNRFKKNDSQGRSGCFTHNNSMEIALANENSNRQVVSHQESVSSETSQSESARQVGNVKLSEKSSSFASEEISETVEKSSTSSVSRVVQSSTKDIDNAGEESSSKALELLEKYIGDTPEAREDVNNKNKKLEKQTSTTSLEEDFFKRLYEKHYQILQEASFAKDEEEKPNRASFVPPPCDHLLHLVQSLQIAHELKQTVQDQEKENEEKSSDSNIPNDENSATSRYNSNKPIDLEKLFTPASDSGEITPSKNRKMFASSSFYSPHHPTVEDQIQLARRISSSLCDISNKQSKGQSMYVNRMKRSVKWVHGGENLENQDSEETLAFKIPNVGPKEIKLNAGEPKDMLKLVMNPHGKVQDIYSMHKQGNQIQTPPPLTPEKCFDLVRDLNNTKGKGAELFAKRRKKSEKWVIDETNVKQTTSRTAQQSSTVLEQKYNPRAEQLKKINEIQEKLNTPRVKLIKSPWEAALETGSVDAAFQELPPVFPSPILPTSQSPLPNLNPKNINQIPGGVQKSALLLPNIPRGWGATQSQQISYGSVKANMVETPRQVVLEKKPNRSVSPLPSVFVPGAKSMSPPRDLRKLIHPESLKPRKVEEAKEKLQEELKERLKTSVTPKKVQRMVQEDRRDGLNTLNNHTSSLKLEKQQIVQQSQIVIEESVANRVQNEIKQVKSDMMTSDVKLEKRDSEQISNEEVADTSNSRTLKEEKPTTEKGIEQHVDEASEKIQIIAQNGVEKLTDNSNDFPTDRDKGTEGRQEETLVLSQSVESQLLVVNEESTVIKMGEEETKLVSFENKEITKMDSLENEKPVGEDNIVDKTEVQKEAEESKENDNASNKNEGVKKPKEGETGREILEKYINEEEIVRELNIDREIETINNEIQTLAKEINADDIFTNLLSEENKFIREKIPEEIVKEIIEEEILENNRLAEVLRSRKNEEEIKKEEERKKEEYQKLLLQQEVLKLTPYQIQAREEKHKLNLAHIEENRVLNAAHQADTNRLKEEQQKEIVNVTIRQQQQKYLSENQKKQQLEELTYLHRLQKQKLQQEHTLQLQRLKSKQQEESRLLQIKLDELDFAVQEEFFRQQEEEKRLIEQRRYEEEMRRLKEEQERLLEMEKAREEELRLEKERFLQGIYREQCIKMLKETGERLEAAEMKEFLAKLGIEATLEQIERFARELDQEDLSLFRELRKEEEIVQEQKEFRQEQIEIEEKEEFRKESISTEFERLVSNYEDTEKEEKPGKPPHLVPGAVPLFGKDKTIQESLKKKLQKREEPKVIQQPVEIESGVVYESKPFKDLIQTFEENSRPILKYKQISEDPELLRSASGAALNEITHTETVHEQITYDVQCVTENRVYSQSSSRAASRASGGLQTIHHLSELLKQSEPAVLSRPHSGLGFRESTPQVQTVEPIPESVSVPPATPLRYTDYTSLNKFNTAPRGWKRNLDYYRPVTFTPAVKVQPEFYTDY